MIQPKAQSAVSLFLLYAMSSVLCPAFNVQRAISSVLCPACYVQHSTSTVLCPPCYVQRAMSSCTIVVKRILYLDDNGCLLTDWFCSGDVYNRLIKKVPPEAEHKTFYHVASVIFRDGVFNWGRVVALFYFAYNVCLKVGRQCCRLVGVTGAAVWWGQPEWGD